MTARLLTVFVTASVLASIPFVPACSEPPAIRFTEAVDVIPLEARSRRKWDAPVVADFDQDGYLDLLLTDHSYRARLHWNNGGVFSEPVDLIRGDTHGVAVGDYDNDGRIDLVVSRGGGGGKKPRNPVAFQVNRDRTIEGGEEFAHFERSRGRAAKLVDWDRDGRLDLVLTAFPLKSQPQGANHLFHNAGTGQFDDSQTLPQAQWMGFRALATDFDSDSQPDLILYGGDDIVAVRGRTGMSFENATQQVLGPLAETSFASGVTEIDYDNDGDFDLFLTRADHPFDHKTYFDPDGRTFAFFARFTPTQYEDLRIDGDFRLENLQMAYPHFDVTVGAEKRLLEFNVDRHGHKDFTLRPDEAEGWPDDRSAKGLYIGHLGGGVWRIAVDTKSPTTGVVHNVVSKPTVTPPQPMPARLFENRGGEFVDVTQRLGVLIAEQTTAGLAADFDNDGWGDLLVVKQGNPAMPTEQLLYRNRQGERFDRVEGHGVISSELGATGAGAEAFDYDGDGDLDVILGAERGRWRLFRNDLPRDENRNFAVVRVGWSPEGKATPQGATLMIQANGRTYRRVVGATSAAFSQGMNDQFHIGLGAIRGIDRASVRWSNGEMARVKAVRLNQTTAIGRSRLP